MRSNPQFLLLNFQTLGRR